MSHLYTLLLGGIVLTRADREADAAGDLPTALAWAEDTVLAIGSDQEVRAISRGDSHFVELKGAFVIPLGAGDEPLWPSAATLEVGGAADLAVVSSDPRVGGFSGKVVALVRGGRVIAGTLGIH